MNMNELRTVLRYEPETGLLYWLVDPSRGVRAGEVAGCLRSDGYVRLQWRGRKYMAHRIAWALMTGAWPDGEVDHRDGCGGNNRWGNLRAADRSGNMMNQRRPRSDNATGLLGAHRHGEAFTSTIIVRGRRHHLGRFPTAEQAHAAYVTAKRQLHATNTI